MSNKVYAIVVSQELSDQEIEWLSALLDLESISELGDTETNEYNNIYVQGPRVGTISPANSNLVAAYNAMSHTQ